MTVWLASGNAHKKRELAAVLAACGLSSEVRIPADAGLRFGPDETEGSFHGNALLKARALRGLLLESRPDLFAEGDPVLADDSGICVDALGGRPGVLSARYAGPPGGEAPRPLELGSGERNALLLREMEGVRDRGARFVCAMALLLGGDRFLIAQETLEGEIVGGAESARGEGGFGYDPIFLVRGLGRTAAELSEGEKNLVSHRGKAGRQIAEALAALQRRAP